MAPALHFLCAKEMRPIIWWPAFGAPLLIRIALSALDASCDCACYDQASCIGAADGPCARCAPTGIHRAAPMAPVLYFLCAKEMRPIIWWPAFGAPLLIRVALSALDASCGCAWHDQA